MQENAICGAADKGSPLINIQGENVESLEQTSNIKQRISVEYDAYNLRRYSRPWIARVSAWPVGGVPTMEWGSYVGDEKGEKLKSWQHQATSSATGNGTGVAAITPSAIGRWSCPTTASAKSIK